MVVGFKKLKGSNLVLVLVSFIKVVLVLILEPNFKLDLFSVHIHDLQLLFQYAKQPTNLEIWNPNLFSILLKD
jgi:hypothetical protein